MWVRAKAFAGGLIAGAWIGDKAVRAEMIWRELEATSSYRAEQWLNTNGVEWGRARDVVGRVGYDLTDLRRVAKAVRGIKSAPEFRMVLDDEVEMLISEKRRQVEEAVDEIKAHRVHHFFTADAQPVMTEADDVVQMLACNPIPAVGPYSHDVDIMSATERELVCAADRLKARGLVRGTVAGTPHIYTVTNPLVLEAMRRYISALPEK